MRKPVSPPLPDAITLDAWIEAVEQRHEPATIGTQTVDETGVGEGKILVHDGSKWVCESPGGGGGPHADTHASDGSDPVSPESIGAAADDHGHAQLHDPTQVGAILLASERNDSYGYQLLGKSGTSYSVAQDVSASFVIDFSMLATIFGDDGYSIVWQAPASTAVASGDAIYVRLLDDDGVTLGTGTQIAEGSGTPQTGGANTKGWALSITMIKGESWPTSGRKVVTWQIRHTQSGTYYYGDWRLWAIRS